MLNLYEDKPKDPDDIDVFGFDWSPRLGDTEVLATITTTLVNAAGTTISAESYDDTKTLVTLSGGTAGERAIWTVRVTTSASRTLEEAFAVDIIDSTSTTGTTKTEVERIQDELTAAYALRAAALAGDIITEVWRNGRRVRKQVPTLSEINAMIDRLNQELAAATASASGQARRRPIGLAWRN